MAYDRFTFSSAGLTHELEMAMDRAGGWNAALVKRMCKGDWLVHIREYLLGLAEIRYLASILHIPRSTPFNPARFLGQGWSIWKGPTDGDGLSGAEDQDERSLALTELDLSQVQLVTCLQDRETSTTGEERIKRLKAANHIRLDAQILQTFCWENQRLIPKSWKEKTNGNVTLIFFDGTPLRSPCGHRSVLYLCWSDGGWCWDYRWLKNARLVNNPSVVQTPKSLQTRGAVLASLPAEALAKAG